MAGRAGEGLRKLGGEACYLNCKKKVNSMSPKSWAAPTNSATTMAQKISHLLTVRAEGADPSPSPLTVSLTVKRPIFL